MNALTPQLGHVPLHLLFSLFGPFQRVQAFLQVLQSLFSLLQSLLELHPRLHLCLRHTGQTWDDGDNLSEQLTEKRVEWGKYRAFDSAEEGIV